MFKVIEKWWWKSISKKPPKAVTCYIGLLLNGAFLGVMIIALAALISVLLDGDVVDGGVKKAILFIVLLVIAMILFGIFMYQQDRKYGIYNAIHKASVEYWHKKRKELGIE